MFGSVSYRFLDGGGAAPLVMGTLSAGVSRAHTTTSAPSEATVLTAVDVRAGAMIGKTLPVLGGSTTPYAALRAFGGPVFWRVDERPVTGTDKYHYQPAVGAVIAIAPVDVFVEWAFAGERAISAGIGMTF
jgi:hypothetical protein